jgi:hypothetical protein
MTINLAPSRRSPVLPLNGSESQKPRHSAVFLIANARIRSRLNSKHSSQLQISNRERMAILHLMSGPRHDPAGRSTARRNYCRPRKRPRRHLTKPEFLIVTPGLKIPLKRVNPIPSKFLIVTKRTFSLSAWGSPRSLHSLNFHHHQRNKLSLKWHRHSCLPRGTKGLCSDEHQPPTCTHHPRPHFTFASTQTDPPLQSNSREQARSA